jgi:hypothetical protein
VNVPLGMTIALLGLGAGETDKGEWWPSNVSDVFVVLSFRESTREGHQYFYWRKSPPLLMNSVAFQTSKARHFTVYSDTAAIELSESINRWCAQEDVEGPRHRQMTVSDGRYSVRYHWLGELARAAYLRRPVEYSDAAGRLLARLEVVSRDAQGLPVEAIGDYVDREGSVKLQVFYRPPAREELPLQIPWINNPILPINLGHSEECVRLAEAHKARREAQEKILAEKAKGVWGS